MEYPFQFDGSDCCVRGKIVSLVMPNETSNEYLKQGYKIVKLKIPKMPVVTLFGSDLPPLYLGDLVEVRGIAYKDIKGAVIRAYALRVLTDETRKTKNGLVCFLQQTVRGIGSRAAEALYEAFGDDTIRTIQKHPEKLDDVEIVSIDKNGKERRVLLQDAQKKALRNAFEKDTAERRELYQFLFAHNITALFARRIWMRYREESLKTIQENPYILYWDFATMTFPKVDEFAKTLPDWDRKWKQSEQRMRAGLYDALRQYENRGDAFVKEMSLVRYSQAKMNGTELKAIKGVLKDMVQEGLCIREKHGADTVIYEKGLYDAEVYTAEKISSLQKTELPKMKVPSLPESLDAYQQQAVWTSLSNSVSVITGGPGTGKTTVLKAILDAFYANGVHQNDVALACPTGKGAKKMAEATGHKALTIHRLLQWSWDLRSMKYFGRNPRSSARGGMPLFVF